MIERSAATMSELDTGTLRLPAARSDSAVKAACRSPVTRVSAAISPAPSAFRPMLQMTPRPSDVIWPSVRSGSNLGPAIAGPLQRAGLRAQRYTQAAISLSGSGFLAPQWPHPHD